MHKKITFSSFFFYAFALIYKLGIFVFEKLKLLF